MSFEVVTAIEPDLVRITANGEYSFERLFDFIGLVRDIALKASRKKVLIDCRQLVGDMTEAERFEGGQKIAEIFGSNITAALMMPEIQITKLGELVAVNRGAKFLVTANEAEAISWLARS